MKLLRSICLVVVCLLLVVISLYAKGLVSRMKVSKGNLRKKVKSVAMVSVHGTALINGRNIKEEPIWLAIGKEAKADQKTEKDLSEYAHTLVKRLNNLVTMADYYPFDFIGHNQVIKSKSYQTLIANNLRYSQSDGELLGESLGNIFKKKGKKKKKASEIGSAYYTVDDYGVYVLPPKEVVQLGGTKKKKRLKIFADLGGADAVMTASVQVSFYPKGMMMKGGLMRVLAGGDRAKGVAKVDIKLGLEMANGKQVIAAHAWAESKKDWLFTGIDNHVTIKNEEVGKAKAMAKQAFEDAWGALEAKLVKKLSKIKK